MKKQQDHALVLKIATRVYKEEMRVLQAHRYTNLKNKKLDLKYCQECYDEVRDMLEAYNPEGWAGDERLSHLNDRLWSVARGSVLLAYGALKNLRLRREYLHVTGSLTKLSNQFFTAIRTTPEYKSFTALEQTVNAIQSQKNAESVLVILEKYLEEMEGLLAEWGTRSYPALTPRAFSQNWRNIFNKLRISAISRFNDAVLANTAKHPLTAQLGELIIRHQTDIVIDTYKSIKENGIQLMNSFRQTGAGLALFTAIVMVWQVVQSDHRLEASARATFSIPPAILAGYVGAEAGAWLLGIVSGPGGALLGAIFGGLIGGFAGGLAADSLFDAILHYLSSSTPDLLISRLFGPPLYYELKLPDSGSLTKSLMERLI